MVARPAKPEQPDEAGDESPLELLRLLLAARRFDEAIVELGEAGAIVGHYHASIGLESSAAGLARSREPDDLVVTNYRNHAHLICLGSDPETMCAEILGRDLGPQRGRSGTMHLGAPELGVLYTSAMVAGGVPQALGHAFALREAGGGGICFCFFGDGAFGEGVVHEALNLAALWELPVLFVCENNAGPADGRANRFQSAGSLSDIVQAHEIPAEEVPGNRPRDVVTAMRRLALETREDSAPRYLEMQTVPWPGNQTFFPTNLTGRTDLSRGDASGGEGWSAREDPVVVEARDLLGDGIALDELLSMDTDLSADIATAIDRARDAEPAADGAHDDVWGSR